MEHIQENYNLISAEVVADSLNQFGERLTTMKLVFPRIILAEFNTHRMFNRNSASSRAIPFKKMVKMVQEQPFIPIAWQRDHKGMQGSEYLTDRKHENAVYEWLKSRDYAVKQAKMMNNDGVTKQLCNRLLEPFMYHTVLVTATEWENFFELRGPSYKIDDIDNTRFKSWKDLISFIKDRDKVDNSVIESYEQFSVIEKLQKNKGQAEIHMMALAECIYDAMNESTPIQLQAGEWHIPFGDTFNTLKQEDDLEDLLNDINYVPKNILFDIDFLTQAKLAIATVRCARISYETLGDNPEINYEKDIKLHDDLLAMKHFSPFEHCCVVMENKEYYSHIKGNIETQIVNVFEERRTTPIDKDSNVFGWSRNLKGFKQYREIIE